MSEEEMDTGEEQEIAAPAAPPSGGGKMKLLIFAAIVVLAVGAGAGGAMMLLGGGGGSDSAHGGDTTDELAAHAEEGGGHGEEAASSHGGGHGEKAKKDDGHGSSKSSGHGSSHGGGHGSGGEEEGEEDMIVVLDSEVVNLRASRQGFVKVGFWIEAMDSDGKAKIEAARFQIKDALIMMLSGKSREDLQSEEGRLLIKKQVRQKLDEIVGPGAIRRIGYKELVLT